MRWHCPRSAAQTPCVGFAIQDGYKHHVLATGVLQMGQRRHHFLA